MVLGARIPDVDRRPILGGDLVGGLSFIPLIL
jgi:hypothetical protein